jgi:hypothetical protein
MGIVQLTKPIRKAIEEFGDRTKDRLTWEWFDAETRTGISGYALYICTAFHENGRRVSRRLWCHPTKQYALQIAEALENDIGASDQLQQLRKLICGMELAQAEVKER